MQLLKKLLIEILTLESRLILAKYKPFIVAVTGSVGKTSTKDAIYAVLKDQSSFVRKSEKSMNSEIGLPLTIIGAPNAWHSIGGWVKNIWKGLGIIFWKNSYPDCLILEIGADHPGDIKKVTKWLHPDIAVITKVSKTPVHVEFFKSPEEVFEEKASLAKAVKADGTLILFGDDEKVMTMTDMVKGSTSSPQGKSVKVITYGTGSNSTVRGLDDKVLYDNNSPVGLTFNLNLDGSTLPITLRNVIGNVYMYPLLAAASVGKARGMRSEVIANSLADYEAPKGRMNLISGINGSTIIDDTYNSSPDAVFSALQTLKGLETTGAKIVVLGDMMELGNYSAEEHRHVGKEVIGSASMLVTVGLRSRQTAEEAVKDGFSKEMIHSFETSIEASEYLAKEIKTGDIILVKGSQSMRMERVVKALLKEPSKADSLLVRQEKEWLEKK
ncbi:MAG: UDP-N-acetylmuramoyl-tripeptide--D-alanyl-D-alanine ligase [Candidatus Paceibacterota bacterium]